MLVPVVEDDNEYVDTFPLQFTMTDFGGKSYPAWKKDVFVVNS